MVAPRNTLEISTSSEATRADRSAASAETTVAVVDQRSLSLMSIFAADWHSSASTFVPATIATAIGSAVQWTLTGTVGREQNALRAHLVLAHSVEDWRRAPVGHRHPQLTSEPQD